MELVIRLTVSTFEGFVGGCSKFSCIFSSNPSRCEPSEVIGEGCIFWICSSNA